MIGMNCGGEKKIIKTREIAERASHYYTYSTSSIVFNGQ